MLYGHRHAGSPSARRSATTTSRTALWHDEKRVRLADCFDIGANPCNHTLDRIRDCRRLRRGEHPRRAARPRAARRALRSVRVGRRRSRTRRPRPIRRRRPAAAQAARSRARSCRSRSRRRQARSVRELPATAFTRTTRAATSRPTATARSRARSAPRPASARTLRARTRGSPPTSGTSTSTPSWCGTATTAAPMRRARPSATASISRARTTRCRGCGSTRNVSLAHSQFVANAGNGNALALAPKLMGQGGVTLVDGAHFISLRARGIADRPGNDDEHADREGLPDLRSDGRHEPIDKLGLNLTINNLLNTDVARGPVRRHLGGDADVSAGRADALHAGHPADRDGDRRLHLLDYLRSLSRPAIASALAGSIASAFS